MFSTYKISISSEGFSISNQYREVSNNSCKSIYFRKPVQEDLTGVYEQKYHQFSHRESYALVEGLAEFFPGKCLSRPSVMRRSEIIGVRVKLNPKRLLKFNLPITSQKLRFLFSMYR